MRVLQLNTVSGISSTGRIATDIAQMLEAKGHDCKIIYGIGNIPTAFEKYSYNISSPLAVKIHSGLSQFFDAEGYGSIKATKKAIAFCKDYKPDIIHMHNIHGCFLNIKLWFDFLKEFKKPVLWTMHDCWLFTGHCAYFDYVDCQMWQSICHNCPQSKTGYPRNYIFDFSTRNFKRKKDCFTGIENLSLISPSKWLAELSRNSFLKEYPCHVIYNGVDRSSFYPMDFDELVQKHGFQGKKIILSVANDWSERKGLRYILELEAQIGKEYKFVIIGLSPAQSASLPAGILCIQRTDSLKELAMWYSASSVLLNPTLEDNMPLVNLEALACACPVVVFNTGGCPEIIDDMVGKVVNKADIKALKQAIIAVANNKDSYKFACLEKAKSLDKQTCYTDYIKLYEEVCH